MAGEESPCHHMNYVLSKILETTGQIYTDLPGRSPQKSSIGHRYMIVLYYYVINAILLKPMKIYSTKEWLPTYKVFL